MKASLNGIEMFWMEEGRGTPLVLLHGFPLSCAMWGPQLVHFSRNYRVIAPDLRGFGKTSLQPDQISTMELIADDIVALLDHLKLERAVIVGLSMGGYIALALYRKYPERVQALVLCDTKAEADNEEARAGRYNLIEEVREKGNSVVAEAMLPRLFAPNTYRHQQETVAQVAGLIERNNPAGIIAASAGLAERPDSSGLLPEIKVPALVIVGKDDAVTPPEGARQMAQQIPDWQFSIIPNAGHLSNLENSNFFNQALESFLRSACDD
ncbi:MAG: alpha/beta fold hydrolase [Chloroflexota bacterium]